MKKVFVSVALVLTMMFALVSVSQAVLMNGKYMTVTDIYGTHSFDPFTITGYEEKTVITDTNTVETAVVESANYSIVIKFSYGGEMILWFTSVDDRNAVTQQITKGIYYNNRIKAWVPVP
jgi:hypothetical protein